MASGITDKQAAAICYDMLVDVEGRLVLTRDTLATTRDSVLVLKKKIPRSFMKGALYTFILSVGYFKLVR